MGGCEFLSKGYRAYPGGGVLSLFTEHEQAFVRYDLETAWDDSEAFTVEVGVPLKEALYMMILEVTVDSINEKGVGHSVGASL